MHKKPVIASTRAELDIDEALAYYIEQGSRQAALGFIDALEQAYQHIAHHPESGSLRYAIELDLPELRFWMLNGYPYLIFMQTSRNRSKYGVCYTPSATFLFA